MTTTTCRHHWILPAAQGPVSVGVCRKCHEKREFFSAPEGQWGKTRERRTGGPATGKTGWQMDNADALRRAQEA